MLPEELRDKCEELANAVGDFYGFTEDETAELEHDLEKLCSGEATIA